MGHNPRDLGLGTAESRRLIDGGATAKERLLLQAGIDEAPPNRAGRQRALAALGLAVGTTALASSAKAAMGLPKGVALGQAQWLLFSAVSAAVAVGTVQLATQPDTTSSVAAGASSGRKATTTSAKTSPVERALMGSPTTMLVAPAPAPVESLPLAPAAHSGAAPAPDLPTPGVDLPSSPPAEIAISPSELVTQVAALDLARAALRAGRARKSLALLDRFDQSFPRSSLAPEATVVRVSALMALGQRGQATKLVRAYCRSGGRGAYGHRLMALVGLSEKACEGSGSEP
jgi:hypothetical protein